MKKSYKVLTVFHLIPEFIEFCIPELKSLMSLFGVPPHELFNMDISKINPSLSRKDFPYFPYVYIDVPDLSICEKVLKRSTLITAFLEAISEGNNYDEIFNNIDLEKMKCWLDTEKFAIFVDTHKNKISFIFFRNF